MGTISHVCTKVTLRQRPITNGRISLYLDYYPPIRNPHTMEMTRREYLGIYIYEKPTSEALKAFNLDMLEKAEAIRCMRQTSLINDEFGFFDRQKLNMDCLPYFKDIATRKGDKWLYAYRYFEEFTNGKCKFRDLTVDLCNKFSNYLAHAYQLRNRKRRLSQNSAAAYWVDFKALVKMAYQDKYLRENIDDFLVKMKTEEVHKEFLTLEEVHRLAATPCEHDVLKRASLFSCLTGLRISDILRLDWSEVTIAPDKGYCIRIRTLKTGTEATLPISTEAYDLCGTPGIGKVFKGLKRSMIQAPLQAWLKECGITKHITFHCFRHTYATLQVAAGTDIYTVSKMLTHKFVSTTQIYADLVSEKKREAVNKISLK